MTIIFRGFGDGAKLFEEPVEIDGKTPLTSVAYRLAAKHARILMGYTDSIIELEFPNDPPHERFYQFRYRAN